MAKVKIGHASGSEKGTITGAAGDQTGREVCTRTWYKHSKGWVTLRCKVPGMAEHMAYAAEVICANNNVGYDQHQNQTLWNYLMANGWNIKNIDKKVETDCARMMRVCAQYAANKMGLNTTIPDFYTATLASTLVKTGLFEKLTASKYNTQDAYLERGMIQVTKTQGHTILILSNGDKAAVPAAPEKEWELGERILKNGCEGSDVEELQHYLIQLGFGCGSYGADGDFGDATEMAVEKFQKKNGCAVDGEFGPESLKALKNVLKDAEDSTKVIRIVGGSCYVRSEPNTSGKKLGVAKEGCVYDYGGQTAENGWRMIVYQNQKGWVSGKYSKVEG